ncbi:MAG: SlyX family protein [Myxococcota bacterium]|nr:SlyX family protein [Myxococcota bacterium]
MDLQQRIEDLEARYAFQEEHIRQLDEVLQDYGRRIDRLMRDNQELREQVKNMPGDKNKLQDEVPPHY